MKGFLPHPPRSRLQTRFFFCKGRDERVDFKCGGWPSRWPLRFLTAKPPENEWWAGPGGHPAPKKIWSRLATIFHLVRWFNAALAVFEHFKNSCGALKNAGARKLVCVEPPGKAQQMIGRAPAPKKTGHTHRWPALLSHRGVPPLFFCVGENLGRCVFFRVRPFAGKCCRVVSAHFAARARHRLLLWRHFFLIVELLLIEDRSQRTPCVALSASRSDDIEQHFPAQRNAGNNGRGQTQRDLRQSKEAAMKHGRTSAPGAMIRSSIAHPDAMRTARASEWATATTDESGIHKRLQSWITSVASLLKGWRSVNHFHL